MQKATITMQLKIHWIHGVREMPTILSFPSLISSSTIRWNRLSPKNGWLAGPPLRSLLWITGERAIPPSKQVPCPNSPRQHCASDPAIDRQSVVERTSDE